MAKKNKNRRLGKSLQGELLYRRYLKKDKTGKIIENVDQMFHRVANAIAEEERKYGATNEEIEAIAGKFNCLMREVFFLPNSPTLMNAGRDNGLLSACFVLPIPDSIDGIFDAVKYTALIQKFGGGTGFNFSQLRPNGDIVASSGGTTSGPVTFLKVLAETTAAIQQGSHRRGANMGMMSVHHPDILKFISAKQNPKEFHNFNISVEVTNAFMHELKDNPEQIHVVINPRTKRKYAIPRSVNIHDYGIDDLIPFDQTCDECYTVGDIWNLITVCAHATGEPGICFIDLVNHENPTPKLGQIEATNPCGEQPLLSYEACNLGSINISKFVNPSKSDLDWEQLAAIIKLAVRFLDNVIDANFYPIPKIEQITRGNRKIGLGIMGFHDALILLGIRYDSEQAVQFAEKLMAFIKEHAHNASEQLAAKRGNFPNWQGSTWDTEHYRPVRNAAVTTIAPTGTISLLASCSSGIEPIFSVTSKRRALEGQEFILLHPLIERLGTEEGWLTPDVRMQLLEGIKPTEIAEFPQHLANVLVTAHEIAPESHVRIQAAFQQHIDNAVSKTVNLPANATIEDIDKIYRLAYKLRCKGITVYRDGCRQHQVISRLTRVTPTLLNDPAPRPRPRKTIGSTAKAKTGCGSLFITINQDEQGLFEVFTNLGKAGGCPSQMIEQLKGIRCLSTVARRKSQKDINVLSCPDAIARVLEEAMGQSYEPAGASTANTCPDCKYPLRRESGCNLCDNCGYIKCG